MKVSSSPGSTAVVVPTKNRPHDLALAVESVLNQTALPAQLIIIDQSSTNESERCVSIRYQSAVPQVRSSMELVYCHDMSITGLTSARNRSLELVRAEIVLFLDDDVVLEPDFIEELLAAYGLDPVAAGVSGIVTNYTPPSTPVRLWSRLFMLGPFWDDRQPVYWNAALLSKGDAIPVTRLGGGLMSFRMSAISGVPFDENLTGACDGEDVEYCARLGPGVRLLIAPKARLVHNPSPSGRTAEHWLRRQVRTMWYLYRRNWNYGVRNRLCLVWLNIGFGVAAAAVSFRRLSLVPYAGLALSIRESRRLAGYPN